MNVLRRDPVSSVTRTHLSAVWPVVAVLINTLPFNAARCPVARVRTVSASLYILKQSQQQSNTCTLTVYHSLSFIIWIDGTA